MIYKLVLLLPLIGAMAGFFQKRISVSLSEYIPTVSVVSAAFLSVYLFFADYGTPAHNITLFTWMRLDDAVISWGVRADALTRMMLPVVTIVSSLVHIYSIGYMHEDESRPRFFAYLSLFTFMMLALVTATNFMQLFFGWEGVGLASYLLIGFWFYKQSACQASMKAFIVNRVADCAFILGLGLIFIYTASFDFDTVFGMTQKLKTTNITLWGYEFVVLNVICFLLFIGAMGKSAQFLLHTWLPDAMEGPTPVSALIHAATMVTAGVFLVSRCSFMFEYAGDFVHAFITVIGLVTCFFAATVGMTQFDIKRVIAYSTCSQLGYMFFAAGVGAYQAAAFHLFTHAFFKAMLFLGAGSVIHAMHHEQDMRNMGGLFKKIPMTAILMIIGTLAITGVGIPFIFGSGLGFAGFYSKDMILETAFASGRPFGDVAFYVGVFVAFLTSFYSWRLVFLVFFGNERGCKETHSHAHESPMVMMVPIILLSLGAILAGGAFFNSFVGHDMNKFWANSIFNINPKLYHDAHHIPLWAKLSPLVASLSGLLISYIAYIKFPTLPARIASDFGLMYQFLFKKWYFDELYEAVFVKNYQRLSAFLADKFDYGVIDEVMCGLPVINVKAFGEVGKKIHNGYLSNYTYVMFIGVVLMLAIAVVGGA